MRSGMMFAKPDARDSYMLSYKEQLVTSRYMLRFEAIRRQEAQMPAPCPQDAPESSTGEGEVEK